MGKYLEERKKYEETNCLEFSFVSDSAGSSWLPTRRIGTYQSVSDAHMIPILLFAWWRQWLN